MNRASTCLLVVGVMVGTADLSRAFTVSEWEQSPEAFQKGYVWGIAESLVSISTNAEDKAVGEAYYRCFQENKINAGAAHAMVRAYIARTSDAAANPMVANVLRTFIAACQPYLDATK